MTFAVQRFLLGAMSQEVAGFPDSGLALVHVYHMFRTTVFWYRRVRVWQLQNWRSLAAGAVLSVFAGENSTYRTFSRVADVALNVVEGIEALSYLQRDVALFRATMVRKRQIPVPLKLDTTYFKSSFFSASSVIAFSEVRQEIQKRALLITNCLIDIFVSLGNVSIALVAAQDAIMGHSFQKVEAIYNATTLYEKVSSEKAWRVFNYILNKGVGYPGTLETYVPRPA